MKNQKNYMKSTKITYHKNKIKQFFQDTMLWLFFTNRCPYCGELSGKDETICKDCEENLPVIKGEKCKYCGAEKSRCNCKKHKLGFDGITSPFYYEDTIKKCIIRFKFSNKFILGTTLAKDMATAVKEDFQDKKFDFICFVPFSKIQILRRNYNQSEVLAENLAKELKLPLYNVLEKLFETKSQHKMNNRGRKGNVFGVYDVKNGMNVKGKTILLVDDVKTSGSTLDDCAWILKIRGASEVYCVTAAIAGIKKKEETEAEKQEKTES